MNPTAITKPMLAVAAKLDQIDWSKGGVLQGPKLDGIRCLKINGKALSKNFKPIPNLYIRGWIEEYCSDGFDGELLCLNPTAPFSEVSSMVMSKKHKEEETFVYGVFDWVPGDRLTLPFATRLANVETWFEKMRKDRPEITRHMRPVPHDLAATREELNANHLAWVENGYEGSMIRDPKGPYKCGRSTVNEGWLLKIKDWMDEEAEVIGVEEMMENTNEKKRNELGKMVRGTAKEGMVPKGTMGKLHCRCLTDDTLFHVGGGPGLTAKLRQEIWDSVSFDHDLGAMQLDVIGGIIKFKHQATPGAEARDEGVAPRFPQMLGFRNMEIDG